MLKKIVCTCFLLLVGMPALAGVSELPAGLSPKDAHLLGERMYREGLLPSGEPMQALVQLDVPVEGTMFTCQSCHLRSGLGTIEGTIITLPTNGGKLYRTLRAGAEIETRPAREQLAKPFQGGDIRPAYTDETLAEAISNGVDPNGRELDWTMPRYLLDDREMAILVNYLKHLSVEYSPGVNDTEIRFATVVADDVPQADRDAMLLTLQAVVKDRNSQSRHEESRAKRGPFYRQDRYTAYRRTVLDVWQLHGPRDTWNTQLEAYYAKAPVFALLGGIVTGDWSPIHQFCEKYQLPNIFPITEQPVIDGGGWYTLYFSKGYYQEGEAAARYLSSRTHGHDAPIVQLYADNPVGRLLADGFRQTAALLQLPLVLDEPVNSSQVQNETFWRELGERYQNAVFALWLDADGIPAVSRLVGQRATESVIMSSSLLSDDLGLVPDNLREVVRLTYPYRLPGQRAGIEKTVGHWLKIRNIPVSNMSIQSRIYFLSWMLAGVTRMMEDDFYRDYFLDIFDMMHDEDYTIADYPRVSFGPGQRYASKGCFVVRLGPGKTPELAPVSEWVIH